VLHAAVSLLALLALLSAPPIAAGATPREAWRGASAGQPFFLAGGHRLLAPLRLRGGKLRDEARSGGKLEDVIGPRGIFLRDKGMVTSESHRRGEADKHQQKRFRRKERAAQVADANRMRKLEKRHEEYTQREHEERAPGAGEIMYAATGEALREQQAQRDDPFVWLEKQLDLAENTEGEVPTMQDALKRHVAEEVGEWLARALCMRRNLPLGSSCSHARGFPPQTRSTKNPPTSARRHPPTRRLGRADAQRGEAVGGGGGG